VALAEGYPAICAFVHDELDARVLRALADGGTHLVALRAAGFNAMMSADPKSVGRSTYAAARPADPGDPPPGRP
jgi:hypothetical protein